MAATNALKLRARRKALRRGKRVVIREKKKKPPAKKASVRKAVEQRLRDAKRIGGTSEVAEMLREALLCAESARDEAEESGHRSAGALARAAGDAARDYALVLFQLGRSPEAETILRFKFPEVRFRLSDEVLAYGAAAPGPRRATGVAAFAYDDALPDWLFGALSEAFAADGAFWSSHGYDIHGGAAGFFSYVHELDDDDDDDDSEEEAEEPATLVAARALRGLFAKALPAVREATAVEWWAHCRPHGCGHQLHFDSADEGRHDGDGPRHPIASVVVYLNEGAVGGPTLVTTQTLGDDAMPRRDCAVLVPPRPNRCACFDGTLLHCVVPGRGAAPDPDARRVTLMISYWHKPHARPASGGVGAAMRFPPRHAAPWTEPFFPEAARATEKRKRKPVAPAPVARLWTAVPAADDDGDEGEPVPLPPYEACFQGV